MRLINGDMLALEAHRLKAVGSSHGKSINKRKCRLKDLESKYPELYKESLEKNARNKEDYIMLSLGAVKVHRSGSKRWVKEY